MATPPAGTPHQDLAVMVLRKPHYLHTSSSGSLPRQTLPGFPWVKTTGGCPALQRGKQMVQEDQQTGQRAFLTSLCLLLKLSLMSLKFL